MYIKQNQNLLVFRYKPFQSFDFIKEHKRCLDKVGNVWILKLGKYIKKETLDDICYNGGGLILREPKSLGGRMYFCECTGYILGKPNNGMNYPEYYKFLLEEYPDLDGTWLQISSIHELPKESERLFKLKSNDRILADVINETRTVVIKVYANSDMISNTI